MTISSSSSLSPSSLLLKRTTSNYGSSSERLAIESNPTPPNGSSQVSPPMSHFLDFPLPYSSLFLEKSQRLVYTYTKSSARLGVILFLLNEWIKSYVLQFLSQHDDEQGCPRSLKAMLWSIGNEVPWISHHSIGGKIHLSSKESTLKLICPVN